MSLELKSAPILPLRDIVVFPNVTTPLFVGREKSINALESVMNETKQILLLAQKNPDTDNPKDQDLYSIGTIAEVLQLLKLPDGTVKILEEPKNSLTKQYSKLFEIEGVKLSFAKDALKAIAQKAILRKTGARGLRSIIEEVLLETMFDLPSIEGVEEVIVNKEVISGKTKPLLIYSKNNSKNSEKEEKIAN